MNPVFEDYKKYLTELDDFDFSTFQLKDTLKPNFWKGARLNSQIREKLREIASDFWEKTGLNRVDIIDIIITGSIANYNWTQYSDIDLHIIVDLTQVDEDVDLAKDFFRYMSANWNYLHKIMIKGHEVEIYVQDVNEVHASTGMYSVTNDYWTVKPTKMKISIDEETISRKASALMTKIDGAEESYEIGRYEESYNEAISIREKIRKMRGCGLESGGEYSPENLAFKVLRRNGYLGKLSDLKTKSYDQMMSLNGTEESGIKIKIGATT